jgi:Zn-finger protein
VVEILQGLYLQKKDGVEELYYKLRPEINLQLSTNCETCLFFPILISIQNHPTYTGGKTVEVTRTVKIKSCKNHLWKYTAQNAENLVRKLSMNKGLK